MKNAASLLSYELKTLKKNIDISGDPLGFKSIYWTDWTRGRDVRRPGRNLFFTGRMYQMLPYVQQTTQMIPLIQPWVSKGPVRHLIDFGNELAGEPLIRTKAAFNRPFKTRCADVIRGIFSALQNQGENPGYLFEDEPYTGVLLYDLGLTTQISPHVERVASLFISRGIETIVTLDPHSTFMLRKVYPELVRNFNVQVKNYIEVLAEKALDGGFSAGTDLPDSFVIHDSCYMTRELGIIEGTRTVLDKLGLGYLESPNSRRDTACCGGPVEYAFPRLSQGIAESRIKELRKKSRNILVNCPICFLNFVNHEKTQDVRIWDLGEVLYRIFARPGSKR